MFSVISLYEGIGLAVTIGTTLIAYLNSSDDTKKQNTAFVSILGVVLTLMISMRYDLLPRIEREVGVAQILDKDKQLRDVIERVSRVEVTETGSNPLMDDMVKLRVASIEKNFDQMAQGRFLVDDSEMPSFAIQLVDSAKKEIFATSYVQISHWWETPWGRQYEEINENKVKQGVRITRIFIFSSKDEMQPTLPLIKRELQAGIKVKFVYVAQLGSAFTADMVTVDSALAGELRLSPDKGMKEAEFYIKSDDIAEMKHRINSVLIQSSDCTLTSAKNVQCES